MKVTFFFRRKRKNHHSIERVFDAVIQHLPGEIDAQNIEMPKSGAGPLSILSNCLTAIRAKGKINHVTGDIHYVSLILPKRKTILTIHDIESILTGNYVKKLLLKKLWLDWPVRRCRYVTVISEATKSKLLELMNVRDDRIKVIPNPVANSFSFRPREDISSKPILLQIGTKKNKNLPRLIGAIKEIPCHLIVLGELNDSQINLLTQYSISYENHVNISDASVHKLYERADLLTFVSLFEGFGLPIIEAQLSGIPVITSNISSMPEVAGDGALTVDPHNEEEIKQGITQLISDKELRKKLIVNGKKNAEKYNVKVITQMYCDLYNQMHLHEGR